MRLSSRNGFQSVLDYIITMGRRILFIRQLLNNRGAKNWAMSYSLGTVSYLSRRLLLLIDLILFRILFRSSLILFHTVLFKVDSHSLGVSNKRIKASNSAIFFINFQENTPLYSRTRFWFLLSSVLISSFSGTFLITLLFSRALAVTIFTYFRTFRAGIGPLGLCIDFENKT